MNAAREQGLKDAAPLSWRPASPYLWSLAPRRLRIRSGVPLGHASSENCPDGASPPIPPPSGTPLRSHWEATGLWSAAPRIPRPTGHASKPGSGRKPLGCVTRWEELWPQFLPPPATVDSALVVGGGLGGLTCAIALRSVGVDAQVYERREEVGGGEGTLILVSPNGMFALSRIHPDLVPQFLARGVVRRRVTEMGLDGTVLRQQVTPQDKAPQFGFPFVLIAWNDALDALRSCLPPDCIHLGHTLTGLQQDEERVQATFSTLDGKSISVSAPFVVGADGIRSSVRRLLLGIDAGAHVSDLGRTIWRAMVERKQLEEALDGHPVCDRAQSCIFYGGRVTGSISDCGGNRVYLAFAAQDSALPGGTFTRARDGREMLQLLRTLFQECPLLLRALSVINSGHILERRMEDTPVLDTWYRGRVLLVGDAAHAVSPVIGQGANLAFEDAWELSQLLAWSASLRDALEVFQAIRIPRTRTIVDANRAQGASSYSGKDRSAPVQAKSSVPPDYSFIYGYKGM